MINTELLCGSYKHVYITFKYHDHLQNRTIVPLIHHHVYIRMAELVSASRCQHQLNAASETREPGLVSSRLRAAVQAAPEAKLFSLERRTVVSDRAGEVCSGSLND